MRVLIVNHKADERDLLSSVLARHGCETAEAATGAEGLRLAAEFKPSLIISRLPMPIMGGFQLLREIRSDPLLQEITFIFHTDTFTDKEDEELALSLGADALIVMPEEPEELCQVGGLVIGLRVKRRPVLRANTRSQPPADSPKTM